MPAGLLGERGTFSPAGTLHHSCHGCPSVRSSPTLEVVLRYPFYSESYISVSMVVLHELAHVLTRPKVKQRRDYMQTAGHTYQCWQNYLRLVRSIRLGPASAAYG
jgi:hypothetical protein